MKTLQEKIAYAIGTLISAALLFAALCYPFMILWNNCLVGTIDGVREITFVKTLGVVALFGLLIFGAIVMFSLFTYDPDKNSDNE